MRLSLDFGPVDDGTHAHVFGSVIAVSIFVISFFGAFGCGEGIVLSLIPSDDLIEVALLSSF
jgi:hypothetical protein